MTSAKPKETPAANQSSSDEKSSTNLALSPQQIGAFCILFVAGVWSYWPNIVEMVLLWEKEPDYSHGYLVVPISLAFLWFRRDMFPADQVKPSYVIGLLVVLASVGLRTLAARFFYGPIDNWTLMLWVAGCVLTFFGWRVLWWSLPSIAFLGFAMPLPYSLEIAMRLPLQGVATELSTFALVLLGIPAMAEANVIRIGTETYGVEEACSGIRIFFGIAALAFAIVVLARRAWITRLLILLSILPVAIVANSTRIVITCILYQEVGSDAAKRFSHDFAGMLMIPFAAILLGGVLWILTRVLQEREVNLVRDGSLFQSTAGKQRPG